MYSEPWFRKFDGWWYTYTRTGGKRRQLKLARDKDEAFKKWHELCAKPAAPIVAGDTVAALLDVYLGHCQRNRAEATYTIYKHHLTSFCRHVGRDLTVDELKPKHVTAWLDACDCSDSTKAGAAQAVRSAFLWLMREGHTTTNPVAGAKAPRMQSREVILSDEQVQDVLRHSRPDFRMLLEFLRATGCRPQEAVAIEPRHVDLSQRRIVFPASEAKGKKHPRVIYLNDRAFEIIQKQCKKFREGKILRNAQGKPWNRNMVRCRFLRLRPKVGASFCAYHLRHTFATMALQRLDPITVATLMGHSDASTLAKTYQHLAKLPLHMQEAANRAAG